MKPHIKFRKNPTRVKNKRMRSNLDITGYSKEDLSQIIEKNERKEKIEKRKQRKHFRTTPPKINNLPTPPPQKSITLNQNLVFAFIQFLLQKNLITKEELRKLTLSEDNPLKDIQVEVTKDRVLSREELRDIWIQMMHQNNLYCELCGNPITEVNKGPWRLTAEHRMPRSKGGKTDSTNLDPAHSYCNNLKADMLPEEWAKIGLSRMRNSGIQVDFDHVGYRYMREHYFSRKR